MRPDFRNSLTIVVFSLVVATDQGEAQAQDHYPMLDLPAPAFAYTTAAGVLPAVVLYAGPADRSPLNPQTDTNPDQELCRTIAGDYNAETWTIVDATGVLQQGTLDSCAIVAHADGYRVLAYLGGAPAHAVDGNWMGMAYRGAMELSPVVALPAGETNIAGRVLMVPAAEAPAPLTLTASGTTHTMTTPLAGAAVHQVSWSSYYFAFYRTDALAYEWYKLEYGGAVLYARLADGGLHDAILRGEQQW